MIVAPDTDTTRFVKVEMPFFLGFALVGDGDGGGVDISAPNLMFWLGIVR